MSIGKEMLEEINKQINEELFSEYIYLSMSAYFESINLKGFATWMKAQAGEEHEHAMKFFEHINARGGRVKLQKIETPTFEWESPLRAFENALEHEKHITSRIHHMVEIAMKNKDYAANSMLQWFVDEQVEEEANADEIVQKLKMIGDSAGSLIMLDKTLGKRKED